VLDSSNKLLMPNKHNLFIIAQARNAFCAELIDGRVFAGRCPSPKGNNILRKIEEWYLSEPRHITIGEASVKSVIVGRPMKTITDLIEKLIDIEGSIGVKTNFAIRKLIVEAQDYALELQREMGEVLRSMSRQNVLQPIPAASLTSPGPRSGWHRALTSIQRTIF
jgi:hypothetical protein